jgi:hypothetical protein
MSLLHGSANCGIALRERSAAGEWAAASEMDFIFLVVSRLAQAPLIDCGCPHAFLYPASRGHHERTQARCAQSLQERHVAIATDDAAQQRPVCKFVAGRCAPSVQRRSNAFASFGRQHMPARYDWLTRLQAGRSGWFWHPLFALRRRTFFYPTRFSINH